MPQVVARAEKGKHYGVVMLPEGLIEFIPEFNHLISEINNVLAAGTEPSIEAMAAALTPTNKAVFAFLPKTIKLQLLLDRDPHGNVQVLTFRWRVLVCSIISFFRSLNCLLRLR